MESLKSLTLDGVDSDLIPRGIGIYAWVDKETESVVYIGSATGKYGLYQRVWSQHLNPKYLEIRKHVFTEKDIFQLENPIYHNGQVAIDKSSFRRKIARRYLLKSGRESVHFIREHFSLRLAVYPPDEQERVVLDSKTLIQLHKPLFNSRSIVDRVVLETE